ncbi:hypothetical protein HPB49_015192 [Dermacentor silvarum]|uniref:Uncharacterized protein n=1 Tax=Dermacentor silvarum TaxID=543639 RepID=A0ACB8E137_DERSI|nr:hypothetical protein HPB49_015192 [Dermacentor silvarum]
MLGGRLRPQITKLPLILRHPVQHVAVPEDLALFFFFSQVAIVFTCSRECLCVPIVTPSKGRTRFANISIHRNQPHRKPLPSVHKLNTSCLQDNSFCESLPGYPK